MVLRVLISGVIPYDSGKTWLVIFLAKKFLEHGIKVSIFKPVAGHSAWYQYSTVVESFKRGILVGEDIVKYLEVIKDIDIGITNPIDILLAPPDLLSYVYGDVYNYIADLDNQFNQIVLARINKCFDKTTQHFVFRENIIKTPQLLRYELEKLAEKLNATSYDIDSFIKLLKNSVIEDELYKCLEIAEHGKDIVLIESFNNAITPFRKIINYVNILLVVAPGIIIMYNNVSDIAKALDKAIEVYGEKGFETIHILSMVKPIILKHIKPRINKLEDDEYLNQIVYSLLTLLSYNR